MLDWNMKTWGLAFVIALGVTFEVIKLLPSSKTWEPENFQAPKVMPYSARINTRAALLGRQGPPNVLPLMAPKIVRPAAPTPPPLTKEQLDKMLAAAANKPAATEFDHDKKAEGKKDDEFEIVMDPKTGKLVKKKKKKKVAKKKEEEKKKEEPKATEQKVVQEDEDQDASEQDIDAAITTSINTGKLAPLPKNKADSPFESAEDWIKRLLGRPNLAETNRFIDHYRKNLVTSEVFYKIVNMMLEDSRPEMKKLGIHSATNVPTALSFQLLVASAANARNDASVKAKAEEGLKSYTQIARLPILKTVLKSGTPAAAAIKAANLVKTSAEQNLKAQASSTPPVNPQTQARNQTTFQAFMPILETLSRTATDPHVKTAASETKTALEALLGGSNTPSTLTAQQ
jgi:hypothetical protein